jgi:hypothetical protein
MMIILARDGRFEGEADMILVSQGWGGRGLDLKLEPIQPEPRPQPRRAAKRLD